MKQIETYFEEVLFFHEIELNEHKLVNFSQGNILNQQIRVKYNNNNINLMSSNC